jgi:glycosyltransferase involved in cell wall biosynthesis
MGWEDFQVGSEAGVADLVREVGDGSPVVKPGKKADFEYGVTYQGPWETYRDGVNIAVRRHASALHKAGVPVFLRSESFTHFNLGVAATVEYSELPPVVLKEVDHLTEPRHGNTSVHVRHIVPTLSKLESIVFPKAANYLSPEGLATYRGRMVIFSAWEENKIPEEKVRCLNMVGQVWVTSSAAAKWLEDSGVDKDKLRVVPHPFYGKDPVANIGPRPKRDVFRFLNISKWESRKGQHDLIGGFLKGFKPGDNVELVLKLNPFASINGYPDGYEDSVKHWLANEAVKDMGWDGSNVGDSLKILWKADMNRKQLAQLYAACDCYVSAGRSEGFDLPAFDAKLSGIPVVHADSGGPLDFCNTKNDIKIGGSEKRELFDFFYEFEGSTWHAYDSSDMKDALLEAYCRRDEELQPFDRSPFTMSAVGTKMRTNCCQLADELSNQLEGK